MDSGDGPASAGWAASGGATGIAGAALDEVRFRLISSPPSRSEISDRSCSVIMRTSCWIFSRSTKANLHASVRDTPVWESRRPLDHSTASEMSLLSELRTRHPSAVTRTSSSMRTPPTRGR